VTLLLVVGVILASLGSGPFTGNLELTRAGVSSGEVWRLWTSALVHFGPVHAGVDALAVLVGGMWFEHRHGRRVFAVCLLLVVPLTAGAVLVLDPRVQVVRGASAVAVFLIAAAWLEFWLQHSVHRAVLIVLALVFLARQGLVLLDAGRASVAVLPMDVAPAASAHLVAVVLAGLAVWLMPGDLRTPRCGECE
jgi:membrane associated rhomboid family serine protease